MTKVKVFEIAPFVYKDTGIKVRRFTSEPLPSHELISPIASHILKQGKWYAWTGNDFKETTKPHIVKDAKELNIVEL